MSGEGCSTRYRRSPFCLLHWDGPRLCALECNRFRLFRGAERFLGVLSGLTEWTTAAELAARTPDGDVEAATRALERLAEMGLVLVDEPGGDGAGPHGPRHGPVGPEGAAPAWNLIDLAMQRQSGLGGADPGRTRPEPPPAFKPSPEASPVGLPRAGLDDAVSLRSTLDRRRTVRTYSDDPLSLDDLGRFLWSSARVTGTRRLPEVGEVTRRPSPSGGARHPLEIYPVCNAVEGLERGAYWYDPRDHLLYLVQAGDEGQAEVNRQVAAATLGAVNRDPPVVLVITAVFGRTMWKYDHIGLSVILKDVGALYQTMYLVATALGLAPCGVGTAKESDNARWLGLDPLVESQVGCFLLGRPGGADRGCPPA